MTLKHILLVGLGGFSGSILRYIISLMIKNSLFPINTILVNVLGSVLLALLGIVLLKKIPFEIYLLLGVGFCGGFTTFSTFSYDIFTLIQRGEALTAFIYICLSVILPIIAIFTVFFIFKH